MQWTAEPGFRECGPEDDLSATLASTYDARVELEPSLSSRLQGPFSTEQWPTGTVLTAVSEGETSVVIAERDSVLSCCIDLRNPQGADLNVFTWSVGDLVLTEITPSTEPQLLDYFRSPGEPLERAEEGSAIVPRR